ncbi:hypothetical protein [Rathayibacter sp. VKM Ac-2630]|uniref:hypothetical protein n=1 Tax=Rathayibacter sp. VKM Ac-2630 TaxID=1938617 RepID=UPI001F196DD9|nr:hypothetical protein [Rathayibacter sp. VKM Ac-2630]
MSTTDLDVATSRATAAMDPAREEKDARTLSLFRAAAEATGAEGDRIRERIVLDHLGLAEAMARRVSRGGGAGGDWADLRQVAYVGLVKAPAASPPSAATASRPSPCPRSPASSSAT